MELLRFLAFLQSEDSRTICSSRYIFVKFVIIWSLRDYDSEMNWSQKICTKFQSLIFIFRNFNRFFKNFLGFLGKSKCFPSFRRASRKKLFISVTLQNRILFEKRPPLSKNRKFCHKNPAFAIKKKECVTGCLGKCEKRPTAGFDPPPPASQMRWHPTHVLYKTPTSLLTWTLRVKGTFRKRKKTATIEMNFSLSISFRRKKTISFNF